MARRGMSRIILRPDSRLLKLALETNTYAPASTGGIVFEIKSMIRSSFVDFELLFFPRDYEHSFLKVIGCSSLRGGGVN